MWKVLWYWLLLTLSFDVSVALFCYNCSATQLDWTGCGGEFAPSLLKFNSTRKYLVNCTGENSMCFVRSWSARAHHTWIVQRGCYQPSKDDPLPRTVTTPTRAMTCKHERLPEAEYTVCLCKADWCNSAHSILPNYIFFYKLSFFETMYLLILHKYFLST